MSKKIVIQHLDGMMEIVGEYPHDEGQPHAFVQRDDQEPICLVKAMPRYFLYKPMMLPTVTGPNGLTGGSFNPNQR